MATIAAVGPTPAGAQVFGPASGRQMPPQQSAPVEAQQLPQSEARASDFAACSAAYHKALEPLRTGRAASLGTLLRALRTTDPELPGKWQINAPPGGKPKPPPKPQRVCVETKDVPARQPRCVRWETRLPEVPPDAIARLQPTPDEARVLKTIGDFIEARGALPEVGGNGRHTPVFQRLTGELRQYISQEAHAALCAGTAELMEFYEGQAAPLKKRGEDIATLAQQARALSEARVRAIAVAEQRVFEKAVADAAKIEDQRTKLLAAHQVAVEKAQEAAASAAAAATVPLPTGSNASLPTSLPPPVLLAAPKLPELPVLPPKPNAPAKPEDYAVIGFPSLLSEALRPLVPQMKVLEIIETKSPVKMLMQARAALLDTAIEPPKSAPEVRDAALMALRMLEARAYGELYVARYKDLDTVLFGSLVELRKAQSSACTCQN